MIMKNYSIEDATVVFYFFFIDMLVDPSGIAHAKEKK